MKFFTHLHFVIKNKIERFIYFMQIKNQEQGEKGVVCVYKITIR